MVDAERLRRPAKTALEALAVAVLYFAAGRLGLLGALGVEDVVVTPIWPPTGVAVAALLVYGVQVWPGIAAGAALVIASLTTLQPTALINITGNTLAPLCAVLLLRRVGFRLDITRLRDGLALVFLGALAAMLVSATMGVGGQLLTGDLASDDFWPLWLAWWVGDAMGVLLVTPLLLLLLAPTRPLAIGRWKERGCLFLVAVALVPLAADSPMSLLFLIFPLLIWAALRLRLFDSMVCALFASVLATFAANTETGAFMHMSNVEVMVKLQAFNGAAALTALLLSSLVTEQRATRRSVQQACDELAEVLDHLSAGEAMPEEAGWPGSDGNDGTRT
ncbi:MASE1 domain-containing protein [Streptomyces cavernicola]|uniref:MASE1 domain-containing protein n=1 Tax=Streptomyces cavernicola TaxID=3043613 RepID=A0ABT6SBK6_9ACTN|nr:MASE1 domain-containing protein [Streptomyces sp. B-S-A6]MDI3405576.1 MASE1 domain-containing protein [Streptomyces sp. B-S-A6]